MIPLPRTRRAYERGAGETMTPGPMVFRGPMNPNDIEKWKAHRSPCDQLDFGRKNRWNFGKDFFIFVFWRSPDIDRNNLWNFGEDLFFLFGHHLISDGKTVEISGMTFFFFEITSFFGPNNSIFTAYFGLYKTTIPSHLSCPRAHVRLSAPLRTRCLA